MKVYKVGSATLTPNQIVSDKSSTCDHRSSELDDEEGEGGQKGPPGIGTACTLPSLYLTVYTSSAFWNEGYDF